MIGLFRAGSGNVGRIDRSRRCDAQIVLVDRRLTFTDESAWVLHQPRGSNRKVAELALMLRFGRDTVAARGVKVGILLATTLLPTGSLL